MSIIVVNDEEELKQKFTEAVWLMRRMRKAQKRWHQEFGYIAKRDRENWEKQADEFIDGLVIKQPDEVSQRKLHILKIA